MDENSKDDFNVGKAFSVISGEKVNSCKPFPFNQFTKLLF
jgi:hypothetical protein